MSYKCGEDRGNSVIWEQFIQNISIIATTPSNPAIYYNSTSCLGKQGNVLSLVSNTNASTKAKATFLSPRYYRSRFAPARCLRFRYRLWGPGAIELKLYQVMDDKELPQRAIWIDDDNRSSTWREGQVSLSAVTGYKIVIEGKVSSTPGLLSIGALYTTHGYCSVLPSTAQKVCNGILTNNTGYILSPYYPSYYSNNAKCNWTIKAKQDHVIRLDIREFELEISKRCENDYVELYDGDLRIGRYCGIRYPLIIQSTTNQLSVVFKSNNRIVRTGFTAYYRILEDDEKSKDCIQECPDDCACQKLVNGRLVVSSQHLNSVPKRLPKQTAVVLFSRNKIFRLESMAFYNLKQLSFIDLSLNRIFHIGKNAFFMLPSLNTIRLNMNFLTEINDGVWTAVETLQSLDLGDNLISIIGSRAFINLKDIKVLSLRGNLIKLLQVEVFENNTNLSSLYLQSNVIQKIPSGLFTSQGKLKVLQLHNNKIQTFDRSSFKGLTNLEKLTLHKNVVKESTIPKDAFSELKNLKYLTLDSFILCCYAKRSIPDLKCESQTNSFSSCEDMLKSTVIRISIWIQGTFASLGNLAVICWWTVLNRKKTIRMSTKSKMSAVQSLLLRNLAFADFFMGIYLLFIAIQDALWKGEYVDHDVDWRSGISCQIAGAISTLSSEVSVMMLVVMTADRFSTIVFDFKGKHLNLKTARCICLMVWVIGLAIALSPLIATGYFNDQATGFTFYGRSTVCLSLQLSSDQPAGWEYSVAVFMAFNGASFVFILIAYVAIFVKVQRSAKSVQSTREHSSLGKRIMFIVITDFCCWMPIIVIGILSLIGQFKDPTGQVYAWIAVFVLPLNSSINPVLYTFATPQARKVFHSFRVKMTKQNQDDGIRRSTENQLSSTIGEASRNTDQNKTSYVLEKPIKKIQFYNEQQIANDKSVMHIDTKF